jgi:hypothetical protein
VKWILVTAAFGSTDFHDSATRLIAQAEKFKLFHECIVVSEENLEEFAPRILNKYGEFVNLSVPGFGYFAWKPEIIQTTFEKFPECGVFYVDAGCELNYNFITKLRLKGFFRIAKNGSFFHTLNYPEAVHTKNKVLEYFEINSIDSLSPQIQATWFLLSGATGKKISKAWLESTLKDLTFIDDSRFEEDSSFLSHRHDQSIFSCVIKSMGVKPNNHRPCYRPLTPLSKLNCFLHPVWSARNRSGKSLKNS